MVYIKDGELEIKAIKDSDEAAVIRLVTDEIVKQTYMLPDFENREQAAALFRRLRDMSAGEERFVGGIFVDGEFIGFINQVEIENNSIELGYALTSEYHNRGYCSRALRLCIGEMFDRGFEEVICGAFEHNLASLRVMEKCGMAMLDKVDIIEYRGKFHRCLYRSLKKNTKPEG